MVPSLREVQTVLRYFLSEGGPNSLETICEGVLRYFLSEGGPNSLETICKGGLEIFSI